MFFFLSLCQSLTQFNGIPESVLLNCLWNYTSHALIQGSVTHGHLAFSCVGVIEGFTIGLCESQSEEQAVLSKNEII